MQMDKTKNDTVDIQISQKFSRSYLESMLMKIFELSMNGVRFIRLKIPVYSDENTDPVSTAVCVLNDLDMENIFARIKRGINRNLIEKNEPPVFTNIHDLPDAESEYYDQLFKERADTLDQLKNESDIKVKVSLIDALSKLEKMNRVTTNIRKVDMELILALAKYLDPTVTKERVIEILEFEKERMR